MRHCLCDGGVDIRGDGGGDSHGGDGGSDLGLWMTRVTCWLAVQATGIRFYIRAKDETERAVGLSGYYTLLVDMDWGFYFTFQ